MERGRDYVGPSSGVAAQEWCQTGTAPSPSRRAQSMMQKLNDKVVLASAGMQADRLALQKMMHARAVM